MIIEKQLLFFFSALGAFNGLFLSVYFAFFAKNRSKATYFLAALMFVVSVRITKSAFLFFNSGISEIFIDIGLTACALIGPFLYLYVKTASSKEQSTNYSWLIHIIPYLLIVVVTLYLHPYKENQGAWFLRGATPFGHVLYTQWFVYLFLAVIQVKGVFIKLFKRKEKLTSKEIWLLNIVSGVCIVWLAYRTNNYTSYIVGALSFSFVFYVSLMLWLFRRKKINMFSEEPIKYAHKKISSEDSKIISSKLDVLFIKKQSYRDTNLKISEVAKELGISTHLLSQYLNDNLGKSFADFINEYRVNAAETMLKNNNQLTLEAIGQECGFKSNSSFYAAFKKFKGITPGKIKTTK